MILFTKDENRGVLEAKQPELPRPNEVEGRIDFTKKRAMCNAPIRYNRLSYWFLQT